MKYKNHTITAEVVTERAVYDIDEDGNTTKWLENIDCEPEIVFYGVQNQDGEWLEWLETLTGAKWYIDGKI